MTELYVIPCRELDLADHREHDGSYQEHDHHGDHMSMQISYKIRIEGEFLYREITAVIVDDLGVPSDISRAVRIEEIISSAYVYAQCLEELQKAVSDAVLVVEE